MVSIIKSIGIFMLVFSFDCGGRLISSERIKFCSDDKTIIADTKDTLDSRGEEEGLCICESESSVPWGLRVIRIDCSERNLNFTRFDTQTLPVYTETLDLTWNNIKDIPQFISESLKTLQLSFNSIRIVFDKNFIYSPNLRSLDLSSNEIESLSINSFAQLRFLKILNLSNNKLKKIPFNLFSPLINLELLNLNNNHKLNESVDIQDLDFSQAFGLTAGLKILQLQNCNLKFIHLIQSTDLEELYLRGNQLRKLPDLPSNIEYLQLSDNPIGRFTATTLPHLLKLETLLLEDMRNLTKLEEFSLLGFPSLKVLSFENSKRLSDIDSKAFQNDGSKEKLLLKELNLRGTSVKSLNSSLTSIIENLEAVHLSGTNLICDCNIKWIQDLLIKSKNITIDEIKCMEPGPLKGSKLIDVQESQFGCNDMPSWLTHFLNGLLTIFLILLCSGGIWLMVVGLKPIYKTVKTNKIDSHSPYARVTIEPNRGENYY